MTQADTAPTPEPAEPPQTAQTAQGGPAAQPPESAQTVPGSPAVARPGTPTRRPRGRLKQLVREMPLRSRLLAILLVLLLFALASTGWATQFLLRGYLVKEVDRRLTVNAQGVTGLALRVANTDERLPGDYVVQLSLGDGNAPVYTSTPSVGDTPRLPNPRADDVGRQYGPITVGSVDGNTRWRVVAYNFRGAGVVGVTVVALPLNDVEHTVTRLQALVLIFGLAVAATATLLGWFAIRRAFRPLGQVETTAAAIAAGDLSRRMPQPPPNTEVGRLTAALNGMLSQIETAFRAREASEGRTRRFAADASHELRTPLASIRGFAELYRQGAVREPDDVARTMGRIEKEAIRMGTLVEDLLLLARLDEQRAGRQDPVDLAVLAGDAVHDVRGLDPDRQVKLVGLGPSGSLRGLVTGDENRLRQVVANLVANAVRHTPPGTGVEVAVGTLAEAVGGPGGEAGQVLLEVRDHGPGLTPEQAAKVFERFYRIDSSRTRASGGSGLGLSIVAAVVSAHGGTVAVTTTPGGGATFRVSLPARIEPEDPEENPTPADLSAGVDGGGTAPRD